MNTKTRTTAAGWPGPFETKAKAEEYATSLDTRLITILGIIQENDGWYVAYAYKITTTLPHDAEEG